MWPLYSSHHQVLTHSLHRDKPNHPTPSFHPPSFHPFTPWISPSVLGHRGIQAVPSHRPCQAVLGVLAHRPSLAHRAGLADRAHQFLADQARPLGRAVHRALGKGGCRNGSMSIMSSSVECIVKARPVHPAGTTLSTQLGYHFVVVFLPGFPLFKWKYTCTWPEPHLCLFL